MKTITLQKLIESTNIPESLIRATVRQSGGWAEFKEHAEDVTNHGASGGFLAGFTTAKRRHLPAATAPRLRSLRRTWPQI
jgi:hypothetical protein